jgi:hypothetical protein
LADSNNNNKTIDKTIDSGMVSVAVHHRYLKISVLIFQIFFMYIHIFSYELMGAFPILVHKSKEEREKIKEGKKVSEFWCCK